MVENFPSGQLNSSYDDSGRESSYDSHSGRESLSIVNPLSDETDYHP